MKLFKSRSLQISISIIILFAVTLYILNYLRSPSTLILFFLSGLIFGISISIHLKNYLKDKTGIILTTLLSIAFIIVLNYLLKIEAKKFNFNFFSGLGALLSLFIIHINVKFTIRWTDYLVAFIIGLLFTLKNPLEYDKYYQLPLLIGIWQLTMFAIVARRYNQETGVHRI